CTTVGRRSFWRRVRNGSPATRRVRRPQTRSRSSRLRRASSGRGYDEPAILSYAISSFCPTSADGLHKPAGTEATLKETVKALTRKYGGVFYLLKATNAVVSLPGEMFRELSFLVSSRRNIKSFDLLIISGGGQLTEKDGPWGFPYTIFKWVVLARSVGVRC